MEIGFPMTVFVGVGPSLSLYTLLSVGVVCCVLLSMAEGGLEGC